jgi:hypothetical protein
MPMIANIKPPEAYIFDLATLTSILSVKREDGICALKGQSDLFSN